MIFGVFFRKTRQELRDRAAELHRKADALSTQESDLEAREETLQLLVKNRVEGFEHIAKAWADWEVARAKQDSDYLRRKKHPAYKASEVIQEKGRELAEMRRRMKLAEYVVALYEWHFPWLTELRDLEEEESYVESADAALEDGKDDPVSHWLSPEEWRALDPVERNQRALDRYLRSRLTPWQVGRDYERYVGYLREKAGCSVTYHGIVKGFEDLGRDVLAERDGTLEVIQCKRWAQHKVIHEKHVFQLFGTMVAARIENPQKRVTGTFTTTTQLSDRAREFAQVLDIKVEENLPLDDYPRIKCNIARRSNERIYHLPFDQQYDSTQVEPSRGECYALTVAEAEDMGYRRAWRWRGA
jgi:hypothetical protein